MKKVLLILIILISITVSCRNRECPAPDAVSSTPVTPPVGVFKILTLQPGAEGKDATITFITSQTTSKGATNSKNGGSDVELPSLAWTFDGSPGVLKALIEFDLSSIPASAIIVDAKLSLYACSNCSDLGHEALGSQVNTGVIRRITGLWDEGNVTWNTQPAVTTVNQVLLPASTSQFEDYTDIDVTQLIKDIHADPSTGNGFMISLLDDNYYKRLTFMSGDNPDAAKHPKLVVRYQ